MEDWAPPEPLRLGKKTGKTGIGLSKNPFKPHAKINRESKPHKESEKELRASWAIVKMVMKKIYKEVFCLYCGTKGSAENPLVPDHCNTRNQKNKHWPSKIQPACWSCNASKGSVREDLREPRFIAELEKLDPKACGVCGVDIAEGEYFDEGKEPE